MNQNDHSTRNVIVIACLVIAAIVALIPVLRGWGESIALGSADNALANAELQRAIGDGAAGQAQLAVAEAERFRGLSEALESAPSALSAASGLAINVGLALLLVLAGAGLAWLIGSVGYSVIAYSNVYREVKHAQAQIWLFDAGVTDPNVLPAAQPARALPRGGADQSRLLDIVAGKKHQPEPSPAHTATGTARPGRFGVGNAKPRPDSVPAGGINGILADADIDAHFNA